MEYCNYCEKTFIEEEALFIRKGIPGNNEGWICERCYAKYISEDHLKVCDCLDCEDKHIKWKKELVTEWDK